MRTSAKINSSLITWACLLIIACAPLTAQARQTTNNANANSPQAVSKDKGNYSSLTSLVNNICNDTTSTFYDFFTPTEVIVHPFATIASKRKISMLGVVLADQMLAMINNETRAQFSHKHLSSENQELTGLIQEVDGYLRIHISGRNEYGENRSHVIAVEMSEPLYRALHTTVLTEKVK